MMAGASGPAGENGHRAAQRSFSRRIGRRKPTMPSMSTDPDAQDGTVPPEAPSDTEGTTEASPPASPERMYEETQARLADITAQWLQARDTLLGR
jgi:hypothetical protein